MSKRGRRYETCDSPEDFQDCTPRNPCVDCRAMQGLSLEPYDQDRGEIRSADKLTHVRMDHNTSICGMSSFVFDGSECTDIEEQATCPHCLHGVIAALKKRIGTYEGLFTRKRLWGKLGSDENGHEPRRER